MADTGFVQIEVQATCPFEAGSTFARPTFLGTLRAGSLLIANTVQIDLICRWRPPPLDAGTRSWGNCHQWAGNVFVRTDILRRTTSYVC